MAARHGHNVGFTPSVRAVFSSLTSMCCHCTGILLLVHIIIPDNYINTGRLLRQSRHALVDCSPCDDHHDAHSDPKTTHLPTTSNNSPRPTWSRTMIILWSLWLISALPRPGGRQLVETLGMTLATTLLALSFVHSFKTFFSEYYCI